MNWALTCTPSTQVLKYTTALGLGIMPTGTLLLILLCCYIMPAQTILNGEWATDFKTMKNRSIFKILCCFIIALLNWHCHKTPACDCFEAAGSPSSMTVSVPYFDQIYVNDDINVFLSIGPQEQVEIQGGEHLIKNIGATVSGGVLTLSNNNICDWLRSYKKSAINVYLTMPNITYITSNGIGTIQSTDTLNVNSFQIQTKSSGDVTLIVHSVNVNTHLFGAGDLTLTGITSNFTCNFFSGTGFLYCDKLQSLYTFLSTSTIGDCYITSKGEMDVAIFKEGNVYYSGNPTLINYKTYSKGQLIQE